VALLDLLCLLGLLVKVDGALSQRLVALEAGDETISKSLIRKGATLSSSGEIDESDEPLLPSTCMTSIAEQAANLRDHHRRRDLAAR